MQINLSTIERVKNFVNEISSVSAEVELNTGGIVANSKSIMGIFALNLFEPVELSVLGGDVEGALHVARKYIH